MRAQRDECESKGEFSIPLRCPDRDVYFTVDAQVAEMNSMRRSLFELESKHTRVCMQYEDELKRLHSELMIARGQQPSGIIGRSPRVLSISDAPLSFSPSSAADPPYHPQGNRPSTRNHLPIERERDIVSNDREFRGKARDDSDRDREYDQRDAKRHKAHEQAGKSCHSFSIPQSRLSLVHPFGRVEPNLLFTILDIPMGSRNTLGVPGQSTVKPLSSQPPFNNSLGIYRNEAAGSSSSTKSTSTALPPMNLTPPAPPVEELSFYNVPPEYRKEGPDWYVVFNPQVKKALDVNLQHTFVHAT